MGVFPICKHIPSLFLLSLSFSLALSRSHTFSLFLSLSLSFFYFSLFLSLSLSFSLFLLNVLTDRLEDFGRWQKKMSALSLFQSFCLSLCLYFSLSVFFSFFLSLSLALTHTKRTHMRKRTEKTHAQAQTRNYSFA